MAANLRCMAYKEDGLWVAVCVDLSLAAQANSFDEVQHKLNEQIKDYVIEAIEDKDYGHQLLTRKSPVSIMLKYYWIRLILSIYKMIKNQDHGDHGSSHKGIWIRCDA